MANYWKKRTERQKIRCMKNYMGNKVFKDNQIREVFTKFYQKLFKGEDGKQFDEVIGKKIKKEDLLLNNNKKF